MRHVATNQQCLISLSLSPPLPPRPVQGTRYNSRASQCRQCRLDWHMRPPIMRFFLSFWQVAAMWVYKIVLGCERFRR